MKPPSLWARNKFFQFASIYIYIYVYKFCFAKIYPKLDKAYCSRVSDGRWNIFTSENEPRGSECGLHYIVKDFLQLAVSRTRRSREMNTIDAVCIYMYIYVYMYICIYVYIWHSIYVYIYIQHILNIHIYIYMTNFSYIFEIKFESYIFHKLVYMPRWPWC